ncbi:MAG: competence protein ComEC, partial [Pseudolabrys sp.]
MSIPDGVGDASGRLHETISAWAVAEVAPGRIMPWLPVAFGLGIAVYFTADREPALWTASAQNGMPWQSGRDSSRGRRVALWGVRELFGLLLASLIAGLAT